MLPDNLDELARRDRGIGCEQRQVQGARGGGNDAVGQLGYGCRTKVANESNDLFVERCEAIVFDGFLFQVKEPVNNVARQGLTLRNKRSFDKHNRWDQNLGVPIIR